MKLIRAPWTALRERAQAKRDLAVIDGQQEYALKAHALRGIISECTSSIRIWILVALGLGAASFPSIRHCTDEAAITAPENEAMLKRNKKVQTVTRIRQPLHVNSDKSMRGILKHALISAGETERILLGINENFELNFPVMDAYVKYCVSMQSLEREFAHEEPKDGIKHLGDFFRKNGRTVLHRLTGATPSTDIPRAEDLFFSPEYVDNEPDTFMVDSLDSAVNVNNPSRHGWMKRNRIAYWDFETEIMYLPTLNDEEQTDVSIAAQILSTVWLPLVDVRLGNEPDARKKAAWLYYVGDSLLDTMPYLREDVSLLIKQHAGINKDDPNAANVLVTAVAERIIASRPGISDVERNRLTYIVIRFMFTMSLPREYDPSQMSGLQFLLAEIIAAPERYIF